ncbi:hypothetical protein [uncultured Roseibium sp.]|uniref:hypothetical protein n=1 Tax=uncultured Roseibium sp. TaxID=1936171 RepID=UPI0026383A08|nr:hypothetical protein [uncultured Roseibium sp.]
MFGPMLQRAILSPCLKSLFVAFLVLLGKTGLAHSADLDAFNPAKTDPEHFLIAVQHSQRLKVPVNGARMKVVMREKSTGRVLKQKEIFLTRTSLPAKSAEQFHHNQDKTVSIFRIPEVQIDELRSLQAKFLSLPESRRNAISGSLMIDVAGCKVDPEDNGQMLISTYLKTSELPQFVVLATDYDLRNVPSKPGVQQDDPIKPCR